MHTKVDVGFYGNRLLLLLQW